MSAALPALPLDGWEATKDTLHLWAQIVGKVRLGLAPKRNHWWHVTLHPSARGLTTRRLPSHVGNLEIELDLTDHRLVARTTHDERTFPLVDGLSVAEFHDRLLASLAELDVTVDLRSEPFGIPITTPFAQDTEHASYDADAAARFLTVVQWSADVLEEFAGWWSGKTSPVQLFWHSFDLAVNRFSAARTPAHPGADPVTAEAYAREVISFGFWAGDRVNPFPAYYSYTAPEPAGLRERPLRPPAAEWADQPNGTLALLPYDDVRTASDPRELLLEFVESAFEAGASLAGWDLVDGSTEWSPVPAERLASLSRAAQGRRS